MDFTPVLVLFGETFLVHQIIKNPIFLIQLNKIYSFQRYIISDSS